MNTALIFYYTKPNRFSFHPLAGALEIDETLRGLEMSFPTQAVELRQSLRAALLRMDRAVVGFSFATPQLCGIEPLVEDLRKEFSPRAIFLAGGPHPSADPEGCLRAGFDFVIRGEGEVALARLLESLEAGGDGRGIPGTAYIDGEGAFQSVPAGPPVDLDALPPFAPGHLKFGPIEITRGCPYACGFCQTSALFGRQQRHRSPRSAARYMALLAGRGMRDVRVITPNAFSYGSPDGRSVNFEAMRELLAAARLAMGPAGRLFFGSMPSEVRPEHVTEAALKLVREYASNDNIVIGAQSGSQRILDACGRGHCVADVIAAAALTIKAGLKANVDFIFGLPGETEEDLERTLAVIKELIALGARIHAHWFLPLPQTRLAAQVPGRMPRRLKAALERLTASGALYGQWQAQERQATRIGEHPAPRHAG